ncbi:MAG: MarR family transcriptional regulator [Dehalococcoidia bacterium]|nr:MarR family transcriptional regulator [Dehalococcoidia bacterium]
MADEKDDRQIDAVNQALHLIFMKARQPEGLSEMLRQVNFQDMHVMTAAHEHPDAILKDIKEQMQLPQSTLTSIVNKLEKLGLVRRVINRRDLRSYSLELTEAGHALREEHRRSDRAQVAFLLGLLNEEERTQFVGLMDKLTRRLER